MDLLSRRSERPPVQHVGSVRYGHTTLGFDSVCHSLQWLQGAANQGHLCATLRQRAGHLAAQHAPRTGDHGHFAGQINGKR